SLINGDTREDEIRRAGITANLAVLYFAQKQWSSAEHFFLQALHDVERSRGKESPDLCVILSNLGYVNFKLNNLEGAEAYLRRDLAIRKAVFGSESAFAAASATRLAEVLVNRGVYDEASKLYSDTLRVEEEALGQRDLQVATTLELYAS